MGKIDREHYQRRWEERSIYPTRLYMPPYIGQNCRRGPPGRGGFPEGFVFASFWKDGEMAVYCSDSTSTRIKVERIANNIEGVAVLPYSVLGEIPPDKVLIDYLFSCKLESCGIPVWIDRFILFLPSQIRLFCQTYGGAKQAKIKDISDLVIQSTLDSEEASLWYLREKMRIQMAFGVELSFCGNSFDKFADRTLRDAGQPPLFDYLLSSRFQIK